jgi:23S rRNA (adenine2503-C2)-methyltransferase
MSEKKSIRELSLPELVKNFESTGEKKFRAIQVYDWIWNKGISSFDEMTNLSIALRQLLNSNYFFDSLKITQQQRSKDETTKVLFESIDNNNFEGVLIPGKDRVTACISTQVGCALNCGFCATGKLGIKRNLSVGEIFEQVFQLNKLSEQIFGRKLSNIVIMGMGEPLLNYENTMKAVEQICSETGLGFSPQRITLSTAGIVDGIKRMADDNVKINLSVSIHSAINTKRSEIMPINKKYSLAAASRCFKVLLRQNWPKNNLRIFAARWS